MIFYRFTGSLAGTMRMVAWCKENTTDPTFTKNSLSVITGVWLSDEDAVMFRLKFKQ